MNYLGDYAEDATLDFKWSTNGANGASITRATNGTVSVYIGNSLTQTTTGVTDTEDFDGLTGIHHCRIDLSADAAYVAGAECQVVLSAATIDGQTVNAVLASFSIERAGGALALIKHATNGLAAIKTQTVAIETDTQDIQARLPAALVSGRMDASVGAMAANVMTAAAAASDLTTELQSGLATASALSTLQTSVDDLPTNAELATALASADDAVLAQIALVKASTDNLPTDPADQSLIIAATDAIMTRLGAPAGASISADVAAVKADTAATLADTNELQTDWVNGGRLDLILDARASQTSVDGLTSGIITGTAATGTLSTTQATTNLTGYADDQLIGRVIVWLSGACEGEASDITDYASAGGLLTFTALTTTPANGDQFKIV